VTGKQVKCPRCGSATPLPSPRLEPMPLQAVNSPPPPAAPPKPVPEPTPSPPSEEVIALPTVETYYIEEPLPGEPAVEQPRPGELAGLGTRLSGRLQAREAAALVESLARAVEAANRQGSIRRENRPEGVAQPTDGLAKEAVQRDVRALGKILYECILGRPPGADPGKEADGQPLSFRAKAPRLLEIICLKCLEKNPAASYASVQELADDLRRFLGEPVRARSSGWLRSPAVLGLLAIALLAGVAVGVVSWSVNEERTRAEQARADAALSEQVAREQAEQAYKRAKSVEAKARTASENAQRMAEQERKARQDAVRGEEKATEGRVAAETRLAQVREQYLSRTKDLLVGKWKLTAPEKEKDKVTEFTPGGSLLVTPGAGRGTYRLLGVDKLEMQRGNAGAAKEQFTIQALTWNELVLVDKDGKEWKAERK